MSVFTRTATAYSVSNGKALAMTIPADFAREMNIEKGTKMSVRYDPEENYFVVSSQPPQS